MREPEGLFGCGTYFIARDNPEHRRRRALLQLERLGYRVTLEPVVT
jgi:hypothetical protein